MNSYEMDLKFSGLFKEISVLKSILQTMSSKVNQDETLWDNSDIIRNWKISERTLAEWRKKELISYVQLNGKIWYTKEFREDFIRKNSILTHSCNLTKNERRAES